MEDKLKNNENEAQIIRSEDLARHNSRGIYMRDDHCDWGSSGMKDLVAVSYTHLTLPTILRV